MFVDDLPTSLQHCLLLEWLSPVDVWRVARAGSSALRNAALTAPHAFRAADGEVICDACVHWFRERMAALVLWTTINTFWGGVEHKCNGKTHRDGDLPAVIWVGRSQKWYQNGKLHRDGDKPADVGLDGTQAWYQNDQKHRDGDLPAVVCVDGTQIWYQNGMRHRDGDLPAYIGPDGMSWWKNGIKHRDGDKPVVVYPNGAQHSF